MQSLRNAIQTNLDWLYRGLFKSLRSAIIDSLTLVMRSTVLSLTDFYQTINEVIAVTVNAQTNTTDTFTETPVQLHLLGTDTADIDLAQVVIGAHN
jgi:hypothetical protein